ncbi:MAG: hypothetical protein GF418_11670 [Chitinivibrionales bacterium]|nr:hypothetical protein [Chitinivibrionales bacterium]MBD3396274.1 hypothetical protein [Chitinivibrionales bacterium]
MTRTNTGARPACCRHVLAQLAIAWCIAAPLAKPDTVRLHVGDSFQDSVNAHTSYTVFLIDSGVHRVQNVVPGMANSFVGDSGAVMSGARVLTDWVQRGHYWAHGGQTQPKTDYYGECEQGYESCIYPEDLYMDSEFMKRVLSLDEVTAGTWYLDYDKDSVYMADDPGGHVMEISTARRSFGGPALHVTVKNLVIEKYAAPSQRGAIDGDYPGDGWHIENCEVRLNHATGIQIRGRGAVIRNNYVHHNGQKGIGVLSGGDSCVIENNEIAYNNFLKSYSFGWEGGGVKVVWASNVTIRGNYAHHNHGAGLWCDINCSRILYEANRCEYNAAEGIFHEISDTATIRCNVVRFNASAIGANIQVGTSSNTQVYGNVVEVSPDHGHGIIVVQIDRENFLKTSRWHARNNYVMHNHVIYKGPGGTSGGYCEYGCDAFWESGGNTFDHNTYHLLDTAGAQRWTWNDMDLTFAGMRAAGMETHGTVVTDTASLDSVPGCTSFADAKTPRHEPASAGKGLTLIRVRHDRGNKVVRASFSAPAAQPVNAVLYNSLGKLLLGKVCSPAGSHDISLNASELPPGTYFLRVIAPQRSTCVRVLIVR